MSFLDAMKASLGLGHDPADSVAAFIAQHGEEALVGRRIRVVQLRDYGDFANENTKIYLGKTGIITHLVSKQYRDEEHYKMFGFIWTDLDSDTEYAQDEEDEGGDPFSDILFHPDELEVLP